MQRLDPQLLQPPLNRPRHELRAVVTPDRLWDAPHREQLRQRVEHVLARLVSPDLQRQALPGVLIHDR